MLNFERTTHGHVIVLRLEGQLDALTAPQMKPLLEELIESGDVDIVFDVDRLELVDSSGIGLIVSVFKRARAQGGNVCLVGLRGQPGEVFRLLKLEQAMHLAPSVTAALKYFEG